MKDGILYKTSYNWVTSLLFWGCIACFYFIISVISELAGILFILSDTLLVLVFITRKFVFYEDRVEIVRLIKFSKNKVFKFTDIIKIEYRSGLASKVPPEIILITRNDKWKKCKNSFVAADGNETKFLLKELHDRGINITFNCSETVMNFYKSW